MMSFEDAVRDILSGNTHANALDFAAFLASSSIVPEKLGDTLWKADYNGECICYIHIDGAEQAPGPWTIWPDGNYDGEIEEHAKEAAWAHANICGSCGGSCSPGKPATIFGKTFDNVCNSVMAFSNPDAKALKCLKEVILWKIAVLKTHPPK